MSNDKDSKPISEFDKFKSLTEQILSSAKLDSQDTKPQKKRRKKFPKKVS